jgi:hypothetical protein
LKRFDLWEIASNVECKPHRIAFGDNVDSPAVTVRRVLDAEALYLALDCVAACGDNP